MNHKIIFVNFPNIYELEDWQYLNSYYILVKI